MHTSEHFQFPNILSDRSVCYHFVKFIKNLRRFGFCFSFEHRGHNRSRCFRNGAPFSMKSNIRNHIVFQFQKNRNLVATKRIVTFQFAVGMLNFLKIFRISVMFQNQLLIQLLNFAHCFSLIICFTSSSLIFSKISPANPLMSNCNASFSEIPRLRK